MKKVVFIILGILLVLSMVSVGCSKKPTQNVTPTQNITGTLEGITGQNVTIVTSQGTQTFPIASNVTSFLAGTACSLDEIQQAATGNVSYNCTLVIDQESGEAIAILVTK
ncbi:MAG: hypothetical protein Q7R50_07730 [Dehalococcoidales bacterium]|nr:hypothetical protein [Dehalococcoidales bacterium]